MTRLITRRSVLAGLGFSTLIGSTAGLVFASPRRCLASGERLAYGAHRLIGRTAMAPEFTEADLSPDFRAEMATPCPGRTIISATWTPARQLGTAGRRSGCPPP